jgi:uncharacterized protein (TIGR01732 family)
MTSNLLQMNTVLVSILTLIGLVFTNTSGIISESHSTLDDSLKSSLLLLDENLLKEIEITQLQEAAQNLLNGLEKGTINSQWLESNGLDKNLLAGVDRNQLIETTQKLITGLNNGSIDKQWIETSLVSSDGGGFVLILVLFILLVIIGAGFGICC